MSSINMQNSKNAGNEEYLKGQIIANGGRFKANIYGFRGKGSPDTPAKTEEEVDVGESEDVGGSLTGMETILFDEDEQMSEDEVHELVKDALGDHAKSIDSTILLEQGGNIENDIQSIIDGRW